MPMIIIRSIYPIFDLLKGDEALNPKPQILNPQP